MTILNIVELSAEMLTLERIVEAIKNPQEVSLLSHEQREFDILVQSARTVIDEIGREYAPLTKISRINVSNRGIIPFSAFPLPVLEVRRVSNGITSMRFTQSLDGIVVDTPFGAELDITYTYAPQPACNTTPLEWENGRIGLRLIAFGTVAEYCIRLGMIDEAVLWDRRYKDALLAMARPLREKRVRQRRFK
ncbi:MAG: hypothetical protein FWE13_02355 [Firmicutes bacterium]|nr:hypothetical protein [Bacillota bacterium]